jgi:hypothetical protein
VPNHVAILVSPRGFDLETKLSRQTRESHLFVHRECGQALLYVERHELRTGRERSKLPRVD